MEIHADAVAEALSRAPKRRGPYRKRQLADFALRQLKRAEKYQRQLDREIHRARKAHEPIDSVLIQAVQTAKTITDTMLNAIEQVRRSQKAEAEKLGGLTDDALLEVLRVHLFRLRWSDDDKRKMLAQWFGDEVAELLMPQREVA